MTKTERHEHGIQSPIQNKNVICYMTTNRGHSSGCLFMKAA
jgi:hypothetical protein